VTRPLYQNEIYHQLDGHLDANTHHYKLRVQFEDTDAGGIVYHAQYLAFAERARSAWLRCLGIDQAELLVEDGVGFVVRHIDIDFVEAAALSTVLEITSKVIKNGGASLRLRQIITNIQDCHIVARLVVDIGFVNMKMTGTARACRMPKIIRDRLPGTLED